jgi:multidrug efflux pump subunit AcrA (membrane-fusion protein)
VSLNTTTIASVVPTDEVIVSITVDELDILSLHVGDKALVTIDALPGHSFEGVVTGVNTGRSNNGGNSKYTAEVTLERSDDMLIGMNASCLVTIETFKDVLSIPAAALCDEVKGPVVYTALSKDETALASPVPVEVGISDGETVEILSGLTEGETVWYSVYDTPEYSVPSAGNVPFGGSSGRT